MGEKFDIAVLLLAFTRLDTLKKTFAKVREIKPARLYLGSDGPRKGKPGDIEKIAELRNWVEANVDWDCEFVKLYNEENKGVRFAVPGHIKKFLAAEKMGIILEEDCCPDISFFRFCKEMLEKYKDDERVAMVSGDNFSFGKDDKTYSYFFSKYCSIWGWATWERAFNDYDDGMNDWDLIKDTESFKKSFFSKKIYNFYRNIFQMVYEGKISSWAYRWNLNNFVQNRVAVTPTVNLVSNIGFATDNAINCRRVKDAAANMAVVPMEFPLKHPKGMLIDREKDEVLEKFNIGRNTSIAKNIRRFLVQIRWRKNKKIIRLLGIYFYKKV